MENIISIILPTYNRLYSLKQIFLPSLERQKYLDYELIIIDDDSNDGTKEFFISEEFKSNFKNISERYKYLKNEKNLWAPESRNIWVRQAIWDWIWIVEDDIEIEDEYFLKKFIKIKNDSEENLKVIAPYLDIKKRQGYYELPEKGICYHGKYSWEVYYDPTKQYNDYIPSIHCVAFIEKNTFLEVWWQDGVTFFWNTFRDETDLYMRITKTWWTIFYAGGILKAIHRNDFALDWWQKKVNTKTIFSQEYMIIKNHFLFLRKNYNFPFLRILAFIFVRFLKHLTTFTGIKLFKNFAVKFKI